MVGPPIRHPTEPEHSTEPLEAEPTAAVLVVHGMGQQDRHSTLADAVRGLTRVSRHSHGIELQTAKIDGEYMQCAKMRLGSAQQEVHIYEAYWAPLTAGAATLRQCMWFLVKGAFQGIARSMSGQYRRWMFQQQVPAVRRSVLRAGAFAAALLTVAALAFMNVVVGLIVGALTLKKFDALQPGRWPGSELLESLTGVLLIFLGASFVLWLWIHSTASQVAKARQPSGSSNKDSARKALKSVQWMSRFGMAWFAVTLLSALVTAIWFVVLLRGYHPDPIVVEGAINKLSTSIYFFAAVWIGLGLVSIKVRRLIVDYVGDVVAYVGTPGPSRRTMHDVVRKSVADSARRIYNARTPDGKKYRYGKVAIVGHSLGSVIAYDAFNTLICDDLMAAEKGRVVDRTRLLLTFGSPLDKVAFIFGYHRDEIKEALAASESPLIADYGHRRFKWVNYWSKADIVSGPLDLYDLPAEVCPMPTRRVDNREDPLALSPLAAHTEYWQNKAVWECLHDALVPDAQPG